MTSENRGVCPQKVTELYRLRMDLLSARDQAEIDIIAAKHNLPSGIPKAVLQAYFTEHFPLSNNNGEHHRKMVATEENIRQHISQYSTGVTLMIFGSYSLGVINGTHSDLDYLAIMGRNQQDLAAFEQLEQAGVIVSPELSQVAGISQIIETGRGLARVLAVSQSGVEVEFHVLGQVDVGEMHKLWPGCVTRLTPVPPKEETRLSYRGKALNITKGPEEVRHFIKKGEEVFKGFFPDAMLLATLVLDPNGIGEKAINNVWYATVKAYLYHNNLLRRLESGVYEIELNSISFDDFLNTVMPQKKAYIYEKYMVFYERFSKAIEQIMRRFNIISRT